MGMTAILFNGAEPFEQSDNTPLTGPLGNRVKVGQAVSEKKIHGYAIFYIYTSQMSNASHPDTSYKVSSQWPFSSGDEAQNRFS